MHRMPARVAAACLAVALATSAAAAAPTLTDCLEEPDFVANAARTRDNGITRLSFIDRLERDLAAVRAFAPHLRWFARDPDDLRFLVAAAARVFDDPRPPGRHPAEFLGVCLDRAAVS